VTPHQVSLYHDICGTRGEAELVLPIGSRVAHLHSHPVTGHSECSLNHDLMWDE